MAARRSIFADKLSEFSDFAFGDDAVFRHRRSWRDYFTSRIGPTFDGKLIFEVGCFDAKYLSSVASKYPSTAFVGLDWKAKSIYDGAAHIHHLELKNVALLRGRGQDVRRIFGDVEVDEMWVFHPDPCDREVELKNRLINGAFLNDVHHVLRDARSILALKTDHREYYDWTRGIFESPEMGPAIRKPDFWQDRAARDHTADRYFSGEITLFEKRFLKRRQPIYYFEIRKK
jgi:tRNA G46 methylase TrmB